LNNLISLKEDSLEITKTINIYDTNKDNKRNKIWDFDNIMLELNFRFLNLLWNNSTAYIKVNDDYYWMEHHDWESTDCNMEYWSNPIRLLIKKSEIKNDEIKLIFGIKINLNLQNKFSEIKACGFSLDKFDVNNQNIIGFENLRMFNK